LWHENYRFEGLTIKRVRPPPKNHDRDPGDNLPNAPKDPEAEMAKRALRAANILPYARVGDVAKILRTGERVTLTPSIKEMLKECYPIDHYPRTNFEPKPLEHFTVSRDAVARIVMARSPRSHPGANGITFEALQNFCRWTYRAEDKDNPDYRWDIFCRLIAKIMSGQAVVLSDMLLDVLGAAFNKNADQPQKPFALRNLGIEESIMRIAAALVFELILPKALLEGFLTDFDLGAGRKSGAEIFGRLAAMLARSGSAIAVFDVVKAFNNLRREDIKAAVEDFNDPLLTAFVHFMFSKHSKVSFKCPLTGDEFVLWLMKGIHQGNPLSVFIFCLTVAFILKPFRARHPEVIVATFVDDMVLGHRKNAADNFPNVVNEFIQLFARHGLIFNLSDTAKSSIYSVHALPAPIQARFKSIGMRCQNEGIAPCKIPHGTPQFMEKHAANQIQKLGNRYQGLQALWLALNKYDRSLKKPTGRFYELYLNLVRLSFLSMPTYVLRTLHPSKCVAYRRVASEWSLSLIQNALPKFIELPPSLTPNTLCYPDLQAISLRIMQLPLTLGGFSLRMAESLGDIAYVASCLDCLPMMRKLAIRMDIQCTQNKIPELIITQRRIAKQIPAATPEFWLKADDPEDDSFDKPMQKTLTIMLNAVEIQAIAQLLSPCPVLAHAFNARIDPKQDHVSWTFNPKARAICKIGALNDAEFCRTFGTIIMYPVIAPRTCGCGQPIDPACYHLLSCKYNSYVEIHECVKLAVAARIRSFMPCDIAPMAVLLEQPVIAHYRRYRPELSSPQLIADMVLSLHGEVQQHPVICDFVSGITRAANRNGDYAAALNQAERMKSEKYGQHVIPRQCFFALAFGRTNILPPRVHEFCALVAKHFPTATHPDRKLRATFSRAIYSGVARTLNMAVRRLQISAAARVAVPAIPAFALRLPPAAPAARRSVPKSPLPLIRHESYLRARLAQVMRPDSEELTSSSRRHFGRQCAASDSEESD